MWMDQQEKSFTALACERLSSIASGRITYHVVHSAYISLMLHVLLMKITKWLDCFHISSFFFKFFFHSILMIHSFNQSLIHSFIHLFIHLFIQSFIHSFIHSLAKLFFLLILFFFFFFFKCVKSLINLFRFIYTLIFLFTLLKNKLISMLSK